MPTEAYLTPDFLPGLNTDMIGQFTSGTVYEAIKCFWKCYKTGFLESNLI